jgi:hypothetical protein
MFEVASPSAHHVRTLAITLATLTPVVAKDPMRKHTRHLKFCIEDMLRPRNSSDMRVSRLPYVTFQLLTIQVDKRQFCYYNHVSMHAGTMSHFTHKICVTRFAHAGCINLHIKNVLTFQPCTHKHS